MPGPPLLRFDRARFDPQAATPNTCAFCGRALDAQQFEILQRPACEICARHALSQLPSDSRSRFLRSLAAGTLTALAVGLLLSVILAELPSFTVRIWTAYIAALAIGWTIGKTMRTAAGNLGGIRYQFAGSLLTYAAIIYPLQFSLMGAHESAWWIYPFVLFRPIAFLITGLLQLGIWQLLAAFVGVRLSWTILKPLPLMVKPVG